MSPQPPSAKARPPSIFLSHAHEDKPFVRRLARDLTAHGVRVWIDEAKMGIGDSLLEKITTSISEMDYLGVVISPYSAHSDWVTREVEIAMREDVAGQRVKVLPLLLRGGELPPVLTGKLFADFTSEPAYPNSLDRVLLRLGIEQVSPSVDSDIEHAGPSVDSDRLSELASSSGLLRTALSELRGAGISTTTADALVSARIADVDLSEFVSLAARELQGQQLFGLALSLVRYIDERRVGQEALAFCLNSGRLDDEQLKSIALNMQFVKTQAGVLWCHSRLTSLLRNDVAYHGFLVYHIDTVVGQCYDDMAAYLLYPSRGPSGYNIDSFDRVIRHVEDPGPFQRRWIEWINHGYFDRERIEGSEAPSVLYITLNDRWDDPRFSDIVQAIEAHVHLLVKSGSRDRLRDGLYHLVAMVDARYRGAERVLEETVSHVYDLGEDYRLFFLIREALEAVAAYNRNPSDTTRERLVDERYLSIADADRSDVTGYQNSHD